MSYAETNHRLQNGGIVILDGGTGTELERRGVPMDAEAWCGPATLENTDVLEAVHRDYIAAGAEIITANTYASSRLMLEPAGFASQLAEINRTAVQAALRARETSGRTGVLVAGSLSHMCPIVKGDSRADLSRAKSKEEMAEAFEELALILRDEGCDLILLEMMYDPQRTRLAFAAAAAADLPVWAGFSARRGDDGSVLSFAREREIPFEEILQVLDDFDVAAAGVMHSDSNVTGDAIDILRTAFKGPLMAYPDSGYFKMPHWQFEDVIPPARFLQFASDWVEQGVQIVGGCWRPFSRSHRRPATAWATIAGPVMITPPATRTARSYRCC